MPQAGAQSELAMLVLAWPRPDARTSCSGREASPARSCSCAAGPRSNQGRRDNGMQRTVGRRSSLARHIIGAERPQKDANPPLRLASEPPGIGILLGTVASSCSA